MHIDKLPSIFEVWHQYGAKSEEAKADHYVIYCRKSDEKDDRTSLPAQLDLAKTMAIREGLHVLGIISEQGSARGYGRPKFGNLIKAIRGEEPLTCLDDGKRVRERPNGIIAWKPDRLARNMRDAGEIIELLDAGILQDLRFVMYAFHNDSSGKEHLAMEFARAKAYSDHLQDHVFRGTIRQESLGKMTRPLPPAFSWVKNEDDEHHQKIVPSPMHEYWRNAYQWRLEGKTIEEIASLMNEAGYGYEYKRRTKQGPKKWTVRASKQYVSSHLKNPLHCGLLLVGEKSKIPRLANFNEIYPMEYGEPFPVVVTVEDFKKVNAELFSDAPKKTGGAGRSTGYALSGKVLCSIRQSAGGLATMIGASPRGASGKHYPMYACRRCGKEHSIQEEEVFKAVGEKLKTVRMMEREHKIMVVTAWHKFEQDRSTEMATRKQNDILKTATLQDLAATEEELNRMKYGDRRASDHEIAVHEKKLKRLQEEQKQHHKREERLNEESVARYYDLDAFLELAKNGYHWWKKASPEQKRKMADIIVLNIIVTPEKEATVSLQEDFEILSKRKKDSDGGRRQT